MIVYLTGSVFEQCQSAIGNRQSAIEKVPRQTTRDFMIAEVFWSSFWTNRAV
jgi:hypothetical protein